MATLLGHILGIAILILGVILVAGIIYVALTFDFKAPFFTTEITIKTKSDEKREGFTSSFDKMRRN